MRIKLLGNYLQSLIHLNIERGLEQGVEMHLQEEEAEDVALVVDHLVRIWQSIMLLLHLLHYHSLHHLLYHFRLYNLLMMHLVMTMMLQILFFITKLLCHHRLRIHHHHQVLMIVMVMLQMLLLVASPGVNVMSEDIPIPLSVLKNFITDDLIDEIVEKNTYADSTNTYADMIINTSKIQKRISQTNKKLFQLWKPITADEYWGFLLFWSWWVLLKNHNLPCIGHKIIFYTVQHSHDSCEGAYLSKSAAWFTLLTFSRKMVPASPSRFLFNIFSRKIYTHKTYLYWWIFRIVEGKIEVQKLYTEQERMLWN